MDIEGLGIKLIEQLTEAKLLTSFADIYRLKDRRSDMLNRAEMRRAEAGTAWRPKSIDNLLAGIEASKKQPLWRLLTALNLRHVGTRTAQQLAERFPALMEIFAAQTGRTIESG